MKSKNESNSSCWTATEIAKFMTEATTPSQKGTATKRMKAYVAQRVNEGADASRVEANLRRMCSRLSRG